LIIILIFSFIYLISLISLSILYCKFYKIIRVRCNPFELFLKANTKEKILYPKKVLFHGELNYKCAVVLQLLNHHLSDEKVKNVG
jgi:hypothetical protein